MKVLQLIDSLETGGAERVAVNIANGLLNKVDKSFLCTTRAEGLLKLSLNKEVGYLFLDKKKTIDIKAIIKLYRFVKQNKITIIHAHSTSFFLATIIKILNINLKLVWHDHYGESEYLAKRPKKVLKSCSYFFSHAFSVNSKLENWIKDNLNVKDVSYLPNFAVKNKTNTITKLKGNIGKRIVCLANFRKQKDHLNLLKAFKSVLKTELDWTLHLVGKHFNDDCSKAIFTFIETNQLAKSVFVYGSCSDTSLILEQCDIGVLASKSEGLPLALLEYGLVSLPVIATNVGDCNRVISNVNEGILVKSEDHKAFASALLKYIKDKKLRVALGRNFYLKISTSFTEKSTLESIIKIYKR